MARVERESISPTWINDEQINLLTSTARRFRKEAYCPHCNLTSPPGDHQRTTSQAFKLTHGHMIRNPYQATQLERAICAKHNVLTWYNQTPSHRKQIPPTGQCGAETVMNHFTEKTVMCSELKLDTSGLLQILVSRTLYPFDITLSHRHCCGSHLSPQSSFSSVWPFQRNNYGSAIIAG